MSEQETKSILECKNDNQKTCLHLAAELNEIRCLEKLLELGADPNSRTDFLETPLHLAALAGHVECLKKLIEVKSDLNAETIGGRTALFSASIAGQAECLEMLIEGWNFCQKQNKIEHF